MTGLFQRKFAAQALDMPNVDAKRFDYSGRKPLLAVIDKSFGGPVGPATGGGDFGEERETI